MHRLLDRFTAGLVLAGAVSFIAIPVLGSGASPASATAPDPGVQLPNGRLLTPAGSPYDHMRAHGDASYDLGDFPEGLAISPDNRLAVTSLNGYGMGKPAGFNSFCEQPGQTKPGYDCPGVPKRVQMNRRQVAPDEGLDVVDLGSGKVRQVKVVRTSNSESGHTTCNQGFNCFGFGVTFSPDGRHVYASGGGADEIYDFIVAGSTLRLAHRTPIPSPARSVPADPVSGGAHGFPRSVAVTPDGKSLVVVNEFDSTIELLDVAGGKAPTLLAQQLLPGAVPGQAPVAYLYAVVLSPDGQWAYVTAEGTGVVYAVNLAALAAGGTLGPLGSGAVAPMPTTVAVPVPLTGVNHPTGLAVSPDGSRLLIAGADSDNVAIVPLSRGLPFGPVTTVPLEVVPRATTTLGSTPDAVAFSRDGRRAYVALAGDDAVAMLDTTGSTPIVLGYIPTGWYPTDVKVGPKDGRVYTVAAKGLGSRYVAGVGGYTPAPGKSLPKGASLPSSDYYDGENMPGLLTRVTVPRAARLAAYSATARTDILHAGALDQRPARSPIPVKVGDASPITHVVYIVRENRTFDQVFGDLALKRKDTDADAADQVLATATPNAHEVAGRYAIADHFFSDGEASVQGHWWTSSAASNDYTEKAWRQYYSPRGRPGDSAIVPIASPSGCSIFQKLELYRETHPAFSFENYGELVGLVEPNSSVGTPEKNLCNGLGPAGPGSNSFSDPNYPTQAELVPDDRTRATEFLKNSGLDVNGKPLNNGGSLRNFNYLILSEDHTSGFAGTYTPRSQVAQNDAALGMILSGLSHSAYWSSTAVFVVEDDSQDGVDHVDGHRNVLLVASPYAKQRSADGCLSGYIAHPRYDQTSVLRTMELILGVTPLSAYDAGATPLYDMFQPISSASQLTKADLAPFVLAKPPPFIDETVAAVPPSKKKTALISYSKTLDVRHLDVSEGPLESVLWQSVRDDAVPASLRSTKADDGSETPAASADGVDGALPLVPQEVRPGTPPGLSTVTGLPLSGKARKCAGTRLSMTAPVPPGATRVTAGGHVFTAGFITAASQQHENGRVPAVAGALLLLVVAACALLLGRVPHRDTGC